MSNLGKLLSNIRQKNNTTIAELGRKIEIGRPQLSKWEHGIYPLKEEKLMDILIRGFDIPYSQAKQMIAEFKADEATKNMEDEPRSKYLKKLNKRYGIDLGEKNTNIITGKGIAGNGNKINLGSIN